MQMVFGKRYFRNSALRPAQFLQEGIPGACQSYDSKLPVLSGEGMRFYTANYEQAQVQAEGQAMGDVRLRPGEKGLLRSPRCLHKDIGSFSEVNE